MSKIVGLTFDNKKKPGGKNTKPPKNKKPDNQNPQQPENAPENVK